MAANQTTNSLLKVNQLSKDLNMKSKDLAELLVAEGIEYKSQKSLEPKEFSILFNKLTSNNQITNIEDYLDGITYIPSKKRVHFDGLHPIPHPPPLITINVTFFKLKHII